MYDCGVFIGRFEPFHAAHLASVEFALKRCKNLVIVLGSCNQARSIKNPWTATERSEMIVQSITDEQRKRICIVNGHDFPNDNDLWTSNIRRQVQEAMQSFEGHGDAGSIVLLGYEKDASSFYLKLFPQWDFLETDIVSSLNATNVREKFFKQDTSYRDDIPLGTVNVLKEFATTPEFERLKEEFLRVEANKG